MLSPHSSILYMILSQECEQRPSVQSPRRSCWSSLSREGKNCVGVSLKRERERERVFDWWVNTLITELRDIARHSARWRGINQKLKKKKKDAPPTLNFFQWQKSAVNTPLITVDESKIANLVILYKGNWSRSWDPCMGFHVFLYFLCTCQPFTHRCLVSAFRGWFYAYLLNKN